MYNRRLEAEVNKRTEELALSNTQLTGKNKELDEFIRILSHDLKEPLRSIVGFSQLAKSEQPQRGQIAEYLGFIEKSGKQLHQIINDISTYQNINISETPEMVDTTRVAMEIASTIQKNKEV